MGQIIGMVIGGKATGRVLGEGLLLPLDAARAMGLRLLSNFVGPVWMRALLTRPELRVAIFGCLSIALALALTLSCPLWLLAISPLFLGVPHLLADVRYLVAQPGYHRRLRLALPVGVALACAGFGLGSKAGLLAILAALLLAQGADRPRRVLGRRLLGVAVLFALLLVGLTTDWYWLELGLAHVHNFVAVLLFYLLSRQGRGLKKWPILLFAAGTVALSLGALPLLPGALDGFGDYQGLDADGQRELLAPLLPITLATRLLLLFAFAQAVHYGIWLRLIPEQVRERPAPRPFRASLRALHRDLGGWLLGLATAVGVILALWATIDLAAARTGYFRLALFHGYLELCVLAVWWIEGRPEVSGRSVSA